MHHVEISQPNRTGHRLRPAFCLPILFFLALIPTQSFANVWQDSFGQQWFYEVRSQPGEILSGAWYEDSLTPGSTYRISFDVKALEGRMALYVGDSPPIEIDRLGTHSYEFAVTSDSKRYLNFLTWSDNVVASVNNIQVNPKSTQQTSSGDWSGGDWGGGGGSANDLPKGHYLSFSRERNLKTEMTDVLARSYSRTSSYARNVAQELDSALSTPGVKGFAVTVDWRTLETGDGQYNWKLIDDNMNVARQYGLKAVIKVLDRSFNGDNVMPKYFPNDKVLWTTGGGSYGYVSKRWDPWVYNRMIRLYKAIAYRYRSHEGFGGIATTESAMGNFSDGGYSVAKYETALTQIMTQTQTALTRGKLFWYLNFIDGNNVINLNYDSRVEMAGQVPHDSLVIGGPDVTPDVSGMVGSVNNYRIHLRKTMKSLPQFCHQQYVDLGLGGKNVKSNRHRLDYLKKIEQIRQREQQSWFSGTPAKYEVSTLDPSGNNLVKLHPDWKLGDTWKPRELFDFGQANFGCDYVFWNYRRPWGGDSNQFYWNDIAPVIMDTRYFSN